MVDIRDCKLCSGGARDWFARHGFDWQAFLVNGLEAERFEATGDHFGIMVAQQARKRSANE